MQQHPKLSIGTKECAGEDNAAMRESGFDAVDGSSTGT